MQYLILALMLYFLFRFISGFVFPIHRSVKNMRDNIRQMHQDNPPKAKPADNKASNAGEYIDFEEIKDEKEK